MTTLYSFGFPASVMEIQKMGAICYRRFLKMSYSLSACQAGSWPQVRNLAKHYT